MFNFLEMAGNHEERKVANFKQNDLEIDTALVNDGKQPYETAIKYPSLYPTTHHWVIIEGYDSKAEAQVGHDKWVEIMTTNPPEVLADCLNAGTADLLDAMGGGERLKHPRKEF